MVSRQDIVDISIQYFAYGNLEETRFDLPQDFETKHLFSSNQYSNRLKTLVVIGLKA